MSTGAQVAVLDARGVRQTRLRADPQTDARPLVRLVAFAALGLYGALRWGTMLSPMPTGRMLGLLALAVALAAAGPWLRQRSSLLLIAAIVVAMIVLFALAGLPLRWVRHVRVSVSADAIDEGLSSLPRAFVPYNGINEWVRTVIVLGGGLLLLLARDPGRVRAPGGRRAATCRRGHAADRARDRALDARAAAGRLPARADPVHAARRVRVGRADRRTRRAARGRDRGARGNGGDDRRTGARPAHALVQLRVTRRAAEPRQRRVVRLVAALRAAQLAADRSRDARRRRRAPGLLEDREPRAVPRDRLGDRLDEPVPGQPARAVAERDQPMEPDAPGDAARRQDRAGDRRRVLGRAGASGAGRRARHGRPGRGWLPPVSSPATATRSRRIRRIRRSPSSSTPACDTRCWASRAI